MTGSVDVVPSLAGALPANSEAMAAGTVTASGVGSHMISTTNLLDGASDGGLETPASPASGSARQPSELVAPGSVGSVIPTLSLVRMLETVDFAKLETDEIGEIRDMVLAAKSNYGALCSRVIERGDNELKARIKADGGKALPSWGYDITLTEEFTSYAFDDQKLRAVMGVLKPADAEVIGKVIPAHTEAVPERFERGNTNSIQALMKRYGPNSPVTKALGAAMTRSKTGDTLRVKRVSPNPKTIEAAG